METHKRRLRSVRVLEDVAKQAIRAASSNASSQNTGKLVAKLGADFEKLKLLAMNASEQRFTKALQAAIMRLVTLARKLLR